MNLLPFGKLPAHKPRQFVPQNIDLGEWPQIAPLFDQLESRAANCKTVPALERWLLDWSELSAALDEESSRRYIAMTCHTDNPDAEKAYLHFVEHVEPQLKPRQFALENIYAAHPQREKLPQPRFQVFDRDVKNHAELFRPENVPLETEEAKLSQQYQKLSGSLTVRFRGEEKTLVQMGRYLEEPDRPLRQEAWELVAKRRLQEAEKFDEIFDAMLKLRAQIAKNAGFENYRDHAFRRLGRFDYTPEDCGRFHDAVEKEIMPIVRGLQAKRQKQLKLEKLRPWDLAVDPLNRQPLKPFVRVDEMVSHTQKIFDRLDGELGGGFQKMQDLRLLDLDNHKGKAPGGYQSTLSEARVPFIFMNAVGLHRDVETILHEAGHAFHALAARDEDLYPYRSAPIEFCEVASMSMELLGNGFIEEFYSDAEPAARGVSISKALWGFFRGLRRWTLSSTGFTRTRITRATNGGGVAGIDGPFWRRSGLVRSRGSPRASVAPAASHFPDPFYYIEYGIAQLGALQVWANSKRDPAKALNDYKKSLALGGSRPLPELFQAAGCKFEFSAKTIQPIAKMLRDELEKL